MCENFLHKFAIQTLSDPFSDLHVLQTAISYHHIAAYVKRQITLVMRVSHDTYDRSPAGIYDLVVEKALPT